MENIENQQSISELIDSLNKNIEEIRNQPVNVDKLPSNFELLIRGVSDSKSLDFLFSSKLDALLSGLFEKLEKGEFEKILDKKESIRSLVNTLFGEGSFQGPISTSLLNNIQRTMSSYNYQTAKSFLGKTHTTLKKIDMIKRNLRKGEKQFKDNPELLKKYKEGVAAVKEVLRLAKVVYSNRNKVNKRLAIVSKGLNNIVHEGLIYDEPLYGWEA